MAVKRIDHVAVAVKDLQSALATYCTGLGITLSHQETVLEQQVEVAFLPAGDSEIELLEPTNDDSGVARYIEKRGEGLHHICLEVDDIEATLAELKAKGVALIDETPKRGVHGKIAFVHPRGAHGVLVELLERD